MKIAVEPSQKLGSAIDVPVLLAPRHRIQPPAGGLTAVCDWKDPNGGILDP